MASAADVITQITRTVDGSYSEWHIGVTDDPVARKARVGNPLTWVHWKVDSTNEARLVVEHFLDLGMQQSGHLLGDTVFIHR
jgi:hypothetical protein